MDIDRVSCYYWEKLGVGVIQKSTVLVGNFCVSKINSKHKVGAGKRSWWFRVLVTLAEDLGSISSSHMVAHTIH